jgi:hypothetical protein
VGSQLLLEATLGDSDFNTSRQQETISPTSADEVEYGLEYPTVVEWT